MIQPIRITPPVARPVEIHEARDQCRVTHFEHDILLQGHIDAATEHLDGWGGLLGRCMIAQEWRQPFEGWSTCLVLPMPGITAVALKYRLPDLTEGTVAPEFYQLIPDGQGARLYLRSDFVGPDLAWMVQSVWVDLTAGYGAAPEDVPAALRAAIKMHVQALYDGMPEDDWRPNYDALVAPFRVRRV